MATRGSIIYFVIADMAPTRRPVVWRRLHAIFMNRLRESNRWHLSAHDVVAVTASTRYRMRVYAPRVSTFRDGVVPTQAQIDPMYQYSLQYYQALFNLCLKNSEPCEEQQKRLGDHH